MNELSEYSLYRYKTALDAPIIKSDFTPPGVATVRQYLCKLLKEVWMPEYSEFDGKRPFGYSGWRYDIYKALIKVDLIHGDIDDDGYIKELSREERTNADLLIRDVIEHVLMS